MLLSKFLNSRTSLFRNYVFCNSGQLVSFFKCSQKRIYSNGLAYNITNGTKYEASCRIFPPKLCELCFKRPYSSLLKDDTTPSDQEDLKNEHQSISKIFPQPRVTLNELSDKTPQKIFEIHYKQDTVTPKGGKKKKLGSANDWICSYAFIWPEKINFESISKSKKQAAEKAALQALTWLYKNKRINQNGDPIYDRDKIESIKNTLNEPLFASLSDESMKRVENLWQEYDTEIRNIFAKTHETALRDVAKKTFCVLKDSSLDSYDELNDGFPEITNALDQVIESTHGVHPVYGRKLFQPTDASVARRQMELKHVMAQYKENISELPIDAYADEIRSTIESSRVSIIVGAAGCGKSSRAPVAILNSDQRIAAIVTEPRKVAAIGLSDRVANELGEEVGNTVGYQVRLSSKPPRPPCGSILYCTSGVLLRRLQTNPGLVGCTHVFIDEAHERDVNTDVTLLLLKKALTINGYLKLIIMSATLDTDVFTRYFDNCPVVNVPGRSYSVDVAYVDDIPNKYPGLNMSQTIDNCRKDESKPYVYGQEVVELIKTIDKKESEGAILVFLPGWADIKYIKTLLDQEFHSSRRHLILPVHSRLSMEDQTKIFATPMPGVRKIVLATNIAETSITIPDVVYVIDTGAHKENRVKEGTGTASLETVWISQASAKQRAGRAGRVRAGYCYRLYTREKETEFIKHTTPEILRIPLEQTALDCKTYAPNDKIEDFLSQLPEPPSAKAVNRAVNDLISLGALSTEERLTPLGSYLSQFTLHPRLSCFLLHSAVTRTASFGATVATHLSDNVQIFDNANENREVIRSSMQRYSQTSDHSALYRIQDGFNEAVQQLGWNDVDTWCQKHNLRKDRLGYVKALSKLHFEQLVNSGFVTDSELNDLDEYSDIDELAVATLLSGCDGLLVTKRKLKSKGKLATVKELITGKGERAHIGTESVNYNICKTRSGTKQDILVYFGGYHSQDRRALVLYKTSVIPPHAALMFSKGDLDVCQNGEDEDKITLSLKTQRVGVEVYKTQAESILRLREMLWSTFHYYYERKTQKYDRDIDEVVTYFRSRLIKTIARVLVEGREEHDGNKISDNSINLNK